MGVHNISTDTYVGGHKCIILLYLFKFCSVLLLLKQSRILLCFLHLYEILLIPISQIVCNFYILNQNGLHL